MTKTTDTYNKLIKKLRAIERDYLPIRHKEHLVVDDHIKDFLDLLQGIGGLGIKAIAPIFFVINEWKNWELTPNDKYFALAFCEFEEINKKFTAENFLYEKTGIGFSNTILKWLNERESNIDSNEKGRKTLVISLDANQKKNVRFGKSSKKNDMMCCYIKKSLAENIK